jgi:hypothetical protein
MEDERIWNSGEEDWAKGGKNGDERRNRELSLSTVLKALSLSKGNSGRGLGSGMMKG